MLIPVVNRHSKKEFDIVFIDTKDILYTRSFKGEIHYQTRQGVFTKISTFEEEERFLETQGHVKVDRCYVANMEQAVFYDAEAHRLYFDSPPVDQNTPSAAVSDQRKSAVVNVPSIHDTLCQVKLVGAND